MLAGCSPATIGSLSDRQLSATKLEAQLGEDSSVELSGRIDRVLEAGLNQRRLSASDNAAWQIMHGVVCYGFDLQIETPDRGLVGAVEYAFTGGQIHGFELMASSNILPATGRRGMKARLEPGSYVGQGHPDQWLAVFAMADLPLDTSIQVGSEEFTILDWARQAQYDVTNNLLEEYSWTLIALTHYFPDEPSWRAADGSMVSWEVLVDVELEYDVDSSACGGTHRLAGIVRALDAKKRLGLADSEVWQRAQQTVDRALTLAKENRGGDGALSSYYFMRPGSTTDLSAVLASSGHILEFVALALPQEALGQAWVELATERLCVLLETTGGVELDCGSLYHALNGLKIYRQRRFGSVTAEL